jgi:hypothetical protein
MSPEELDTILEFPSPGYDLELPKHVSKRIFYRYYAGAEILQVPPTQLLTGAPVSLKLGYDVTRHQVRDAERTAMALHHLGYDVKVYLPFYASRFVKLRRYVAEGPSIDPSYIPRHLLKCTGGEPVEIKGWLKELTKLCADARGTVYPALWTDALYQVTYGEGLVAAVCNAYENWAPGIMRSLEEFVPSPKELLTYQLVRDWERKKTLQTRSDYFRTGKEALEFFVNFGAVRREGHGRLTWGPVYATFFGNYLTSKRLNRNLTK